MADITAMIDQFIEKNGISARNIAQTPDGYALSRSRNST
jgi:hypothetical protein